MAGVVRNYMNVEAATENHVMQLEEPYHFKGQTYTEVDLNGIADLNSMNESEAENRLARAGFMVTENASTTCSPASLRAWRRACRRSSSRACRCARC